MNRVADEELTNTQQQVLALLVAGKTPAQAAGEVGIACQTIYNWRSSNPRFYAKERRLIAERLADAVATSQLASVDAVSTLHSLMLDATVSAKDRIAAARELISLNSLRGRVTAQDPSTPVAHDAEYFLARHGV